MFEMRKLNVGYGRVQVLWGLSLSVGQGEIVTVLGPNGAGKSTLLRAALGFLQPMGGAGGGAIFYRGPRINGLACFEQAYSITQQEQASVRMRRSYLKKGDWIYVFSAMSPESGFSKYDGDFQRIVRSFKELKDPKYINRTPKRLGLVQADGTDSLQEIFRRAGMAEAVWPQFAIMNGLDRGAVPPAGKLVKIIR